MIMGLTAGMATGFTTGVELGAVVVEGVESFAFDSAAFVSTGPDSATGDSADLVSETPSADLMVSRGASTFGSAC